MQTFLSSLVTCSLLLHTVLGCCWHYAHESSYGGDSHQASSMGYDFDHHDHNGCEGNGEDSAPPPCQGGPHCHGVCNYLPVQKSQIDDAFYSAPLDCVAAILPRGNLQLIAADNFDRLYESDTGPPLRLHLVHQILLI